MNPLDTVRILSEEIGPRPSASANERHAADWVAQQLRGLGFAVECEPFRAVASFSYAYGIFFGLFVVAAAVYPVSTLAAVLLCFAALVLFALEASSVEVLTRILPKGTSQNVVGVLRRRGAVKRKLVLTAHLDSARSAILWHPRIVPHFRTIFLLIATAMLAEFALYAVGLVTGASWVWGVSLVPAALLALTVLIFVDRETRYMHTRGANDNASGVALMLATAAKLAHEPLAETEVWAVGTGCEESGAFGILRFLERHPFDKTATLFLNFDNIGAGRVSYVTGEGLLFTLKADEQLVEIASAVAEDAAPIVYKTLPTDNTTTLTKGYRGMSLMAFDSRGVLPNWHWRTDTIENVDSHTLTRAVDFAVRIARQIDES
ncbi:MAG: M20/M25/M40 family metallo-hydrolase [Chloroflexi bacterium]|nr:M20/M25/M40 family metallo-hydrolase [Chloroflexota bacterium]